MQALRNTPSTLSVTYYSDGAVADPGVVTVSVTLPDGAVVTPAVSGSGTAERTATLTAAQTAELGVVTASWSSPSLGTVKTTAEIVGAHLFTIAEARAWDGDALANPTSFPTDAIELGRTRISDDFAEICGVSFMPRGRTVTLDGTGRDELLLPDLRVIAVRSVETRSGQTWTAYTAAELADVLVDGWGRLTRDTLGTFPAGRRNVRIRYEHGWERPPLEINRAALRLLREQLVKSELGQDIPERAMSMSGEFGTFSLSTAGRGNAIYGLPLVDSVLRRYAERVPRVS